MDRFATALSEFSGFFPVLSVAIIRPQEMSWTSVIDPFLIECLMKTLEQRDQVLVRGQVLVRVGVFALEVLEQDNDNQDND